MPLNGIFSAPGLGKTIWLKQPDSEISVLAFAESQNATTSHGAYERKEKYKDSEVGEG